MTVLPYRRRDAKQTPSLASLQVSIQAGSDLPRSSHEIPVPCRAQAAAEGAGSGAELRGIAVGTLVCVHVAAVPQDAVMRVVQRVTAFQVRSADRSLHS